MLIGNDIIDLQGESRVLHPRFPRRILSETEWQTYNTLSEDLKRVFVWQAWAVKEAAYKAYRQFDANYIFSAQKIIWNTDENVVCLGNLALKVELSATSDVIYALCTDAPWPCVSSSYINHEQEPNFSGLTISEKVRAYFLRNLPQVFTEKNIVWRKTPGGMPYLCVDGDMMSLPLSFSHHGRFLGYAFLE